MNDKDKPILLTFGDSRYGFLETPDEADTSEKAESLRELNRLARELAAEQAEERRRR